MPPLRERHTTFENKAEMSDPFTGIITVDIRESAADWTPFEAPAEERDAVRILGELGWKREAAAMIGRK